MTAKDYLSKHTGLGLHDEEEEFWYRIQTRTSYILEAMEAYSCARNSELEAEVKRLREEKQMILEAMAKGEDLNHKILWDGAEKSDYQIALDKIKTLTAELDELGGNKH